MSQEAPESKISVLSVLESELENLSPKARVYVQKTKSPVYFLADRGDVLQKTKTELESLKAKRAI